MTLGPGAQLGPYTLTAELDLGHYDVTARLGEGGMGEVWQATDTQLNRQGHPKWRKTLGSPSA